MPGLFAIAAGWMIAWYDVWLTRYGNEPVGDVRRNSTVYGPLLITPDGREEGLGDRREELLTSPPTCTA